MHWANSVGAKLGLGVVLAGPASVSVVLLAGVVGRVVLELARWVGWLVFAVLGVVPLGGAGVAVWHW
jgi:hypothetical protein